MTHHPPLTHSVTSQSDSKDTFGTFVRSDGTVIDSNLICSSPGEGRVGVYLELPQLSVMPGNKTTIPILVINRGKVTDNFRVSVDGIPPEWMPTPRSTFIQLSPGEQREIRLIVQPPLLPQSRAGYYPMLLHITSQSVPNQTVEAKVTIWVTAYTEFKSSLTPQHILSGSPAQIKIHNLGNTQESFTVIWEEPTETMNFVPPQVQVAIPPGETTTIEFTAALRQPRLLGTVESQAFSAQISSAGGQTQNLSGEIVTKGIIPPWVLLVSLFTCCALSAFAALMFSDSNEQAAATQTAQAQLTVTALSGLADEDADGDGLNNAREIELGTDLLNPDTDNDGLLDGVEIKNGSDPFIVDTDGDTLSDGTEVNVLKTSPISVDTDGDGLNDNVDPNPIAPAPTNTPITPTVGFTPPTPSNTPAPTNTAPATATSVTPAPTFTLVPTSTLVAPTVPPTATPAAGGAGLIVFESQRDGNSEIYLMNANGTGQTRLTNNAANDVHPQVSPDGAHILFVSDRDGNNEIYVMNMDGSGQNRLTNNAADDTQPGWSPYNTRIVFVSQRDGNGEIYMMNADGSDEARLTNNAADDLNPLWSPDGSRIAFVSLRDGNQEIYLMNTDGSGQTRLTNNAASDCCLAWSPNGARLAFVSDRDGNQEIYVINADGSALTRLTNQPALDSNPLWSPDGSQIAFLSNRDGNPELYVMQANGTDQVRLTNNAAAECCFIWSPVGTHLTFASDRDGNFEIYVMLINLSGSPIQSRLTFNSVYDAPSGWRR